MTKKQRSYATVSDIQKSLEKALTRLAYAVDTLATLYELAPDGDYELKFKFDDSIIVDAEQQRLRDQNEVREGLMAKWEYRMKWYGETERKAKEMVGFTEESSDDEILDLVDQKINNSEPEAE